jgi:hypothetical protein
MNKAELQRHLKTTGPGAALRKVFFHDTLTGNRYELYNVIYDPTAEGVILITGLVVNTDEKQTRVAS